MKKWILYISIFSVFGLAFTAEAMNAAALISLLVAVGCIVYIARNEDYFEGLSEEIEKDIDRLLNKITGNQDNTTP